MGGSKLATCEVEAERGALVKQRTHTRDLQGQKLIPDTWEKQSRALGLGGRAEESTGAVHSTLRVRDDGIAFSTCGLAARG